jgi:hypothetical protein
MKSSIPPMSGIGGFFAKGDILNDRHIYYIKANLEHEKKCGNQVIFYENIGFPNEGCH